MEEWCNTQGARKLPEGYVKDNQWVVPLDEQLRYDILSQYHDSPAGHPGRDNMTVLVLQHYWWPRMNAWIDQYVKGCTICKQNKIWTMKNKMPLYCIPGDLMEHPFNTIAMDLITQLPQSNGHDTILTIMDQGCSKAVAFLPCSTLITGEGIAKLYLQHILYSLGSESLKKWYLTGIHASCPTSQRHSPQNWRSTETSAQNSTHRQMACQNERINGWSSISKCTQQHDKMTGTNGCLLHPLYTISGWMPPLSWVLMKSY